MSEVGSGGVYVHIPFCASKCHYCDFFSTGGGSRGLEIEYTSAILREFELRREELPGKFSTIYIGGGTPSVLPLPVLSELLEKLCNMALGGDSAGGLREVTVEANPEHISRPWLDGIRRGGATRVSIGVQSFSDAFLAAIGRRHDAREAHLALSLLGDCGINYSADLIYGLPGQTPAQWAAELNTLLQYRPPHFSAYLLSYEPRTRLYQRMLKGEIAPAGDEVAGEMYDILCRTARQCGYHHYEISNFSLPGREAIHNSSYWNLTPYLGLGCSAHSFDGMVRRWNPSNVREYIHSLNDLGTAICITDEETTLNRINDYIITALRTDRGLSLQLITSRWGMRYTQALLRNVRSTASDSLESTIESTATDSTAMESTIESTASGRVRIPEDKWLTVDAILRDIILLPDDFLPQNL